MRVLRLSTSQDVLGPMPQEKRAWYLAGKTLEEVAGEPVETVVKPIWPVEKLPGLVERWMDELEPDLVLFIAAAYWVCYPSVPLRLQRKLGRAGKWMGDGSLKASSIRWLAWNPVGRKARRFFESAIGGEYFFEPEAAAAPVEECLRRIVRHESTVPAVRGPYPLRPDFSARTLAEMDARCYDFDRRVRGVCESLHVAYQGIDAPPGPEHRAQLYGDWIHRNEKGQVETGDIEGRLMVRAWEAARAPLVAAP